MAVIFKDASIVNGTGASPYRGFVAVEDNRIAAVGQGNAPSVYAKKPHQSIDLKGMTLLPGIIDCHVHLCMDGSADPMGALQKDSDPMMALKAARNAQQTLLAGVTTVRDLGGRNNVMLALRSAIAEGIAPGPRVLASGECICMTGGHGWPLGREADGPDGIRRAVREQLKAGVDVIKLMATGGVLTPGVDPGAAQLTLEELRAGVEEAHKAGRRTASHAQGNAGVKNALLAGIDTIEHGIFLDAEAIALFLDRKAALVPTISAPYHILKKGLKAGIPAYAVEKTQAVKKIHIESAKKAWRSGVTIAMGTDAGTPFNYHGDNVTELVLLVELGMTPIQAIVAATRTAAEIIGWSDRIGTIETGKLADLIVVDGAPFNDIAVLQNQDRIRMVMKDGRIFKRTI